MKKLNIILTFLLAITIIFSSCDPTQSDKPSLDNPPSADQLSFEITPGDDAFTFKLKNTSGLTCITQWNLGNGLTATGEEVTATYNFPGEFEVTLTVVTNGGQASISKTLTQTETNYDLLTDPLYINLCGGSAAADGKSWVLDSLTWGHIGVGPTSGNDSDWPSYWGADPVSKPNVDMYDDYINFNIIDFAATYENHNKSYVKSFRKDDPAYSNPVLNLDDYTVTYPGPISGNWTISSVDDVDYLILSANTPIFPNFDVGAENNIYEIQSISENQLKLRCISTDLAWFYILIPQGYERPQITFEVTSTSTGNDNEYDLEITNLVVPEEVSVSNVTWYFDDPSAEDYETSDPTEIVTHTYMQAGTYNAIAEIEDSEGSLFTDTVEIVVASDHPNYTPYVESGMALYVNFDDVFRPISVDQAGGTASMKIVNNPSVVYDNDSPLCLKFSKEYTQYANIYIPLSEAYRFDFSQSTKFKLKVYGTAGDKILLKVENSDLGGNAWSTAAEAEVYTIQNNNTWEIVEYDFTGVGSVDNATDDVTTYAPYSSGYYNVVRVMINAGDGSAVNTVYIDDWAGPLVPGWKKSKR